MTDDPRDDSDDTALDPALEGREPDEALGDDEIDSPEQTQEGEDAQ